MANCLMVRELPVVGRVRFVEEREEGRERAETGLLRVVSGEIELFSRT